ncbi:MAG: hypothetical protein N2V72_08550 [Methanophagales archaeon]|nr:hypothetical protein [Methanophagales archaeon]
MTQVPLIIEYKDEDGNLFSKAEYILIEHHQGTTTGSDELPVSVIVVLVVAAIFVIGLIAYSWKRR